MKWDDVMNTRRHARAALLGLGVLGALAGPTPADPLAALKERMDRPGENLYPDPQEKALARIRFEPDQVVWLFRQATASAHRRDAEGSGLDGLLAEALEQRHRLQAWALTRRLREGDAEALETFRAALAAPPEPEDLAAFGPVMPRLPDELRTSLGDAPAAIAAAAARLAAHEARADYVARAAARPDFYRKRSLFSRAWRKTREGLDGLVDRLEVRFSKENLARFFARLARSRLPDEVRSKADRVVGRLRGELTTKILEDLDDQLEGGLGGRIQEIERVGGFLRTKSAVTRGRLRVLVKLMQELKDAPEDLRLFLPTFREVRRGVRQRRGRAGLSAEARTYVEELDETLETTAFFLERWAKAPAARAGTFNLWRAVFEALLAEDLDGHFAALKDEPDLF